LASRERAQNHQWLTLVSTADWRCEPPPKPSFLTCDENENFTLQNIMGTFTFARRPARTSGARTSLFITVPLGMPPASSIAHTFVRPLSARFSQIVSSRSMEWRCLASPCNVTKYRVFSASQYACAARMLLYIGTSSTAMLESVHLRTPGILLIDRACRNGFTPDTRIAGSIATLKT